MNCQREMENLTHILIAITFINVGSIFGDEPVFIQPEQIHLSVGKNATEMVATWVTMNDTSHSVVEFGKTPNMNMRAFGKSSKFVDGGSLKRFFYVHRVTIPVVYNQTYFYHVGSPMQSWSAVFYFKTFPQTVFWSPRVVFYGDLGNVNARSMAIIQQKVQRGQTDAILHIGDFAYDMNSYNATTGNEFMRMIESAAAYVPYMTCPGNHESAYNFSNYVNRFTMPAPAIANNHFYSFNLGSAHIISVSTEYYFYGWQYGFDAVQTQYNWLIEDLKDANLVDNRLARPWIIVMGHRPMYCSNTDHDDCTKDRGELRTGIPVLGLCGLEDLFFNFGVDLQLWAHEHSYERLWPVYNTTVRKGTSHPENAYYNPNAPVHVTSGSAGCQENHDTFLSDPQPWSAFRSDDYGFSEMVIYNKSHIHIEQYSVDMNKIIDDLWFVKTTPYPSYYKELSARQINALREGEKPFNMSCNNFIL